jgi:hypothetical protein
MLDALAGNEFRNVERVAGLVDHIGEIYSVRNVSLDGLSL